MSYLIHDGAIVTMGRMGVLKDGAVLIEGDRILEVGKGDEVKRKAPRGCERIDARRKIVMPGLVNTHHHLAMSLLRGYADDLPLRVWLENKIWPIESLMSGDDIYLGARLAAVECLLGGCTTVNTMYHYAPGSNEARALADVGLRGVVGHVCFSWRREEDLRLTRALAEEWHGAEGGRIRVSVDPHSPYTVDPDYMRELWGLAQELNEKYNGEAPIIWHIHLAETADEGGRVEEAFKVGVRDGVAVYLDGLGVLDPLVIAAHCVHLSEKDVAVLASRGVKVSHNPVSNLKLGSGVSPVPKLLEAGITVGLGTDSACSNNSGDMFEAMKFAALVHKGASMDPTLMDAWTVLRMATIEGAKALNWGGEIGSIEPGKKADIAVVNVSRPHATPIYSEASHLVYAAKCCDVEAVFVDGRPVVEGYAVKTVDVEDLITDVLRAKERLMERAGLT